MGGKEGEDSGALHTPASLLNHSRPSPQVIKRELADSTIIEVAHRQATIAACGRGEALAPRRRCLWHRCKTQSNAHGGQ